MTQEEEEEEHSGLARALEEISEAIARGERSIFWGGDPARHEQLDSWITSVVSAALSLQTEARLPAIPDAYWASIGEKPETRAEFEESQRKVLDSLSRLEGIDESDLEHVRSFRWQDRSREPANVVGTKLAFEIARLHCAGLADEVARVEQVYMLALDVPLDDKVRMHLARVARLFVLGLDVEVAALARATLETALADVQSETDVRTVLNLPLDETPNLSHRIHAAQKSGLLTKLGADRATVIRVRGNEALHGGAAVLNAVGGPLGVVSRLALCLRELSTRTNAA